MPLLFFVDQILAADRDRERDRQMRCIFHILLPLHYDTLCSCCSLPDWSDSIVHRPASRLHLCGGGTKECDRGDCESQTGETQCGVTWNHDWDTHDRLGGWGRRYVFLSWVLVACSGLLALGVVCSDTFRVKLSRLTGLGSCTSTMSAQLLYCTLHSFFFTDGERDVLKTFKTTTDQSLVLWTNRIAVSTPFQYYWFLNDKVCFSWSLRLILNSSLNYRDFVVFILTFRKVWLTQPWQYLTVRMPPPCLRSFGIVYKWVVNPPLSYWSVLIHSMNLLVGYLKCWKR